MTTYKTSEVAKIIGIHSNTVRLYEELNLIPKPTRQTNGYRVFTPFHIEQFKLARIAFKIEVLQNGLRKKAIEIVKTSATGDFDKSICLTKDYLHQIQKEQQNAEESIESVKELLSGIQVNETLCFKRKETSEHLQISMDALRNWEMNGLLTVKRKKNGYRIYTNQDIQKLKIIRSLRCANYSLEAILRMLNALSDDPNINIKQVLDTPEKSSEIISVCDKLITSLEAAQQNAQAMLLQLEGMKDIFINSTL